MKKDKSLTFYVNNEKKQIVQRKMVHFPLTKYEEVEKLAWLKQTKVSDIVVRAVESYCNRHKQIILHNMH